MISLLLATGAIASYLPESQQNALFVCFSLGSILSGAMASKDLNLLRRGNLLEDWMSKRAAAETKRLEYFTTIARLPVPASATGLPMSLLKLEYFRRYQLEVQLAFYTRRAKDHQRESGKLLANSSWAIAEAALVTGLSGMLGLFGPQYVAIAALGTICTAFSAFAATREEVFQGRRNAERYARTAEALEDLSKCQSEVRMATLQTGDKPLVDFVEAVQEQLSLEHRQWIDHKSAAEGAFSRLEDTLRKIKAETKPLSKTRPE